MKLVPVTPTNEQNEIINYRGAALMIEAVAGSGKTTTLSLIVKRACSNRVPPSSVLGLCFSNEAKKRFAQKLVEEEAPRQIILNTVEENAKSQILKLVDAAYIDLPKFYLSDEEIRSHVVHAADIVWSRYQDKIETNFDFSFEENSSRIEEILFLLYRLKATLTTHRFNSDDFDDDDIEQIAQEFQVNRNAIEICIAYERQRQPFLGEFIWQSPCDFVTDLVSLLNFHSDAIYSLPQYNLILVDEWHDINLAEFTMIQLLQRNARLVAVGDRFQTINTRRGANTKFTEREFDLAFPLAKRLTLSDSQRCGNSISKIAHKVTGRNCKSADSSYSTLKRTTYNLSLQNACAKQVAARVKEIIESRADIRLSDVAIIVREESQTIEIENSLLDNNIAYNCDGVNSYLQRPEILMLRALLHIASQDFETLRGDPTTCKILVSGLSLYMSVSHNSKHWDIDAMNDGEVSWMKTAPEDIAKNPNILDDFFSGVLCKVKEFDSDITARWKRRFSSVVEELKLRQKTVNAADLLSFANQALNLVDATNRAFISRNRATSAIRSIKTFISFAHENPNMNASEFLAELFNRQKKVGKVKNYLQSRKQLTLTTVQAAKGQEWPHVLIPYLENGQFPYSKDQDEEIRYFYVAITRAIESLTLFEPDEEHDSSRSFLMNKIRRNPKQP